MLVFGEMKLLTAAKEALGEEPTDDVMPFSDLKPLTAK